MVDDVNEGIENALNVIVSTTGSSGNMKKELKNIIFDTVNNLRKQFAYLVDTNENNNRKITESVKKVANTKELRGVGKRVENNHIAEPSSDPERNTHCQTESKVDLPSGERVKLYSEAVVGKIAQKVYKLTVIYRDNETAETIKEILKIQINPAEIKVGIESVRTLRDGRVQIETGSVQEAKTLTNSIKDILGDKIETNIQKTRKPILKMNNIPEEISTDNIQDTIMAQNP
jgi:hypothetical protein